MEKVVKRGYVKWTDENGVFHKEPLYDHPEMMAEASDEEKARAEVLRELNSPEPEVSNADSPASAVEEVAEDTHDDGAHHDHQAALEQLRKDTTE